MTAAKKGTTKKTKAEAPPAPETEGSDENDAPPAAPASPVLPEPFAPPLPPRHVSERKKLSAAQKKAAEEIAKDEEFRTVTVRATRKGFYPSEGRIRHPGEEFEYLLHRHTDGPLKGTVEDKLPTWMEHVDGELETRAPEELSAAERAAAPSVIEVHGVGTGNVSARQSPSRSVI